MKEAIKSVSEQVQSQKAAIYIRVSTHWQVDKDSLSVQRRELIAYCEMVLGIKDYFVFEDAGYSAKNTERPDYQIMMNRLRTGEFSHLLVWKIDRISRNLLDFANMYDELKQLGVTFVSKNEQFDTSSAIGEAMLKIILVFAELERKMTAERVTAVMLSRANNGQWNGGRIPYGYDYDKQSKEFKPNPETAKIVKDLYPLYEKEQSLLRLCNILNDNKIQSPTGVRWAPAGVRKLLTNVFYLGSYQYNVHGDGKGSKKNLPDEWITVPNHHEPIIDEETFNRVGFLLKRNRRGGVRQGETYVKKNIHIFAGLMSCGKCGNNMSATLDRTRANGYRPSIYACSSRRKDRTCLNKYISDFTVGPFVFNYISNIIRAKETISQRTSLDVLQNKLLRGNTFENVASINEDALQATKSLLISGETGFEYRAIETEIHQSNYENKERLLSSKKKYENALSRLKGLYLYGEDAISEKDYIIEQQKIISEISEIDKALSDMAADEEAAMNDERFLEKASYFIMVENLLNDRSFDFERFSRTTDPSIPRAFIRSVITKIVATDGTVTSITFKNGVTHHFTYK